MKRTGQSVQVEIHPLEGWQPPVVSGDPWVRSYRWQATFTKAPDGKLQLAAKWVRLGERS